MTALCPSDDVIAFPAPTGTLTRNELSVATVNAMPPYSGADVIRFTALASDEATQDPNRPRNSRQRSQSWR